MKLFISKFISLILVCHFAVPGFACTSGSHQTGCNDHIVEDSLSVTGSSHQASLEDDCANTPSESPQENQSHSDCPRCCHSASSSFLFANTSFISMTHDWKTGSTYISQHREMISQIDPQQIYYPPKI